ncbi:UNVERIFIED_CONTAM: hypothetical protein NCL1_62487 [Trichonephila clavipes]
MPSPHPLISRKLLPAVRWTQ